MSRLRAELNLVHKSERSEIWQRHEGARAALDDNSKAAADHARRYVKSEYKLFWRDLYRVQNREAKHVQGVTTILGRAVFVFSQRERLGRGTPLTLRQMLPLIRNQGKLLDRLDAVHQRERRSLAQVEKAEAKVYTDRIWTNHRAKFERLQVEHAGEREATGALRTDTRRVAQHGEGSIDSGPPTRCSKRRQPRSSDQTADA